MTDHQREAGAEAAERRSSDVERRYLAARDVIMELQQVLLPTALPVLPAVSVAARYLVAARDQAAGGDWFDAVALEDGRLALVVGDVVGHGVAASATMGQLRAVLDVALVETGDLEESLAQADRMATRTPALRAATVCAGVLDPATGVLQYSTCGHPPPLLIAADGSTRYLAATGGAPLGTGSRPTTATEQIDPGDVLLLYSDGLIERPGEPLDAGLATLAQVAGEAATDGAAPTGAPTPVVDRVAQRSMELLTRTGYDDDVTVLAVQRRATPVEALRHELPAEPRGVSAARATVRRWLAPLGPGPEDLRAIEMAVTELVSNAVQHAYPSGQPGVVRVHAELGTDGMLNVAVGDDGRWCAPGAAPADVGGRGLWIAGKVIDDLTIDHGQPDAPDAPRERLGTTVVTLRHRMHHPAVLASEPAPLEPRSPAVEFSAAFEDGPPRTLRVSGSVDITNVAELAANLEIASRGGVHPLVVDLTETYVLGSAGVRALFGARDQHAIHGQRMTIVAPPASLAAQVLDMVGLDHVPAAPE
ncbi:SpoIIE family protein phosphatase [Georgenia sp. MJ206]|uniref:SpoIIE family protein phosphatase n=1 Tax=Georgenia wangjunii TaxID=3117730 RepID=UPI002F2677E2